MKLDCTTKKKKKNHSSLESMILWNFNWKRNSSIESWLSEIICIRSKGKSRGWSWGDLTIRVRVVWGQKRNEKFIKSHKTMKLWEAGMKRKVRVKRNLETRGGREKRWKGFQVNAKPAFYLIGQRSSVASEVNYWNLRRSDIFVLWNHLNLRMLNICAVMIIMNIYFSKCQTFSFKSFH